MSDVLTPRNLRRALQRVVRNKGAGGVDGMAVRGLRPFWLKEGDAVMTAIRLGKYRPSPVRRVRIPKPSGGFRLLGIPTAKDRMIQQAMALALVAVTEEVFHARSYAYRPRRSVHQAVQFVREYILRGHQLILMMDIRDCFGSLTHSAILEALGAFADASLLDLTARFLTAGIQIGADEIEETICGTPQGGPLSPLLANLVLDPLDWYLESLGVPFARYADDLCIVVTNRIQGEQVFENVTRFLYNELALEVKAAPQEKRVIHFSEVDLLGFTFGNDPEVSLRIPSSRIHRITERLRVRGRQNKENNVTSLVETLQPIIPGWSRFYRDASVEMETLFHLDQELLTVLYERFPVMIDRRLRQVPINELTHQRLVHYLEGLGLQGFTQSHSLAAHVRRYGRGAWGGRASKEIAHPHVYDVLPAPLSE